MQKKTVLVVEDQRLNKAVVDQVLGQEYCIQHVNNGREALDYLETEKLPDAMLLDINMPVMDGYEVLQEMKERGFLGKVPVLVASQEERNESEIKALDLGASDYVTKPFNPAVLRKRLGNLVRLKQAVVKVGQLEMDNLTPLYNKTAFCEHAGLLMEQMPEKKYDIVVTDLEHFKMFNESYGYEEGDKLLGQIGAAFKELTGELGILCCREYGDRFLLCMERDKQTFNHIYQVVKKAVDEYPLDIKIQIDFGIYQVDEERIPVEFMCDRAVCAVNRCKGVYGFDVAYFDEATKKHWNLEQQIANDMVKALKNGEFEVYLQPKYDLFQEKLAGAEALVRWISPEKGIISPADFVPVFEQNGFITELDMFIWERTCQIISQWLKESNKYVPVSINVSRKDIYKDNLPQIFRNLLKKYHLKPKHLHLEITESAYTENPDQLMNVIDELKADGFTIEMDDFGSGYSSLSMLAKLPIDILKLDMGIIQSYGEKNSSRSIIHFIMGLARWMNLYVVAEGVETQKQVDFLKSLECNYVQGYYYSPPLPAREFGKKLAASEVSLMASADDDALNDQLIVHDYKKDQIMLVIDDLSMNRAIMSDCFKDSFTIVEATNGEAALSYFSRGGKADIITLDIFMPQMDGFGVLDALRKDRATKNIPVIITSQADDATIIKAIRAGAADFLTKPYTKEDAMRCVKRAMEGAADKGKAGIEELRNRESMMMKLSMTDYLTGLWNRACFEKETREYLNERQNRKCSLILIDLDNFKEMNENYGRKIGDDVLTMVAERLLYCFREGDYICRLGGDEFAVLMKANMELEDLEQRMRAFHKNMMFPVKESQLTCSSGLCRYPSGGKNYGDLYENAERALHQAKREGKNRCVIYS